MSSKENFIRAVLAVFWLLILSRIPSFVGGTLDGITLVSTVVELAFFIWGMALLRGSAPDARPLR